MLNVITHARSATPGARSLLKAQPRRIHENLTRNRGLFNVFEGLGEIPLMSCAVVAARMIGCRSSSTAY